LAAQADEIEWYSKPETILSKDENGYPLGTKMEN
jgi:propionyl-CoA synthetase